MKASDLPVESNRSFVASAGGVSFAVDVGDCSPAFYITRTALELYFGATAAPDDAPAALSAFDRHVHQIHRLARELWRRRPPDAPVIVMTVDAVFSALTRR